MQAKFAYGGSILSSSQFWPLPKLPLKTTLAIKVVKIGSKIIIIITSSSICETHCIIDSPEVNLIKLLGA
jgi:hypothetical protein